ncbi:MAG: U32 family peptidase [Methanothrix sp.]|jgi:putative protease|uniref:U32 family peptidase n=1 Tax=Methanothrix sp. TaxID=90426 RepID=UPI00247DF13F|nr:U32 family peptidase [Methanothrix sp.]
MRLKRSNEIPELLAPAGSWDALVAAVSAGADAVYLGGKRFSARMFAENFPSLEEAVDYAHSRGVRVYVTVNTLVHDGEIDELGDLLTELCEIGADAILVQDPGVVRLAREIVPELELHASTQMTIHSTEGVVWAARNGLKRVVLARELSVDEIKNIKIVSDDLGVGLEVFVHGALCYSYSGQCLLSSSMGGRSGNRGMCAQPCRKPYTLLRGAADEYGRLRDLRKTGMEGYLLSTRDLCTYPSLDKIVATGVDALKIEGRMKSAEYVAVVTGVYRDALDAIARGEWAPDEREIQRLALAFNRGFTEGYILGASDVMGREMPDNRGVIAGRILRCSGNVAVVSHTGGILPEPGDGVVLRSGGEEIGFVVRERIHLRGGVFRLRVPEGARAGMDVYITRSARLRDDADRIIRKGRDPIPLDLRISFDNGVPVADVYLDGPSGRIKVSVRGSTAMESARTLPLSVSQIESHLRRTGGTQFVFREMVIDYPGGLYTTPANLNQLRRDILRAAEAALVDAHKRECIGGGKPALERAERRAERLRISVYADTLEVIEGALTGGADRVYFEPLIADDLAALLEKASDLCEGRAELVWKWPRITRDRFLCMAGNILRDVSVDGIMVENLGALVAAERCGCEIFGGQGLNIWNSLSVCMLSRARALTLSPELSASQISSIAALRNRPDLEVIAQGNIVIAVTEDRLISEGDVCAIGDRKRVFPVRRDSTGVTNILNSVETCLLDHIPQISSMGVDSVAIDARWRTGRYAREMTEIYARAVREHSEIQELKSMVRRMAMGGITSGHFLRGVAEAGE